MSTEIIDEHINPDFVPHLRWGDPLPLLWTHVQPGLWHVWLPAGFTTPSPEGPVSWRLDRLGYHYEPERECAPASMTPPSGQHDRGETSLTKWGGSLTGEWIPRTSGIPFLSPGRLRVAVGPVEVTFDTHNNSKPLRFEPCNASNIRLPTGGRGVAYASGRPFKQSVEGSDWLRTAPGGTWWPGTLLIEPTGVEFVDAPALLPLERPSDAEIAAALPDYQSHDGTPWRSYLTMVQDLSTSERFMQRVREDGFARHVFTVLRDNDNGLIFSADRSRIYWPSERRICGLLAILRCYGESYANLYGQGFFCVLIPQVEQEVIGLLHEVGYSVEPEGETNSSTA